MAEFHAAQHLDKRDGEDDPGERGQHIWDVGQRHEVPLLLASHAQHVVGEPRDRPVDGQHRHNDRNHRRSEQSEQRLR